MGKLSVVVKGLSSLVVVMAASVGIGLPLTVNQQIPVGKHPRSILTADLNNDGNADLITTDRDDNRLTILTADQQGTFTVTGVVPTAEKPAWAAAADFDRDGDIDVAVANSKTNTISVHSGNGAAGFPTAVSFAVKRNPVWVGTGDLDGNGWMDIVALCSLDNRMALLMGTGGGAFAAPVYTTTGLRPVSGALADLDDDGAPDVVVVTSEDDKVSIHYGDGAGSFEQVVTYSAGNEPEDVSVVDLDRDGLDDLAIAALSDHAIVVLWGTGPRTFSPPTSGSHFFDTAEDPQSLVTLDMDGDCVADAAAASPVSGEVLYLPGNGQGGFQGAQVALTATQPQRLVAADFNHDMSADLAVTDTSDNSVVILRNDAPACGQFIVRRSIDPSRVASSAPYREIGPGPFDDDEGTLSDGSFYFYTLEHVGGLPAAVSVHPNLVLDAVRLGFNDGDPTSAGADEEHSTVTVVEEELEGGGMMATVTVVPRDANGTGVGLGCDIHVDTTAMSPGVLDGPLTDLGNGVYMFHVISPLPGASQIVVTVEGTTLDAQPMIWF